MTLSPTLLRSLAIGIGLGTAATSCSILGEEAKPSAEHDEKCTKDACVADCQKALEDAYAPYYDCPGCGMG